MRPIFFHPTSLAAILIVFSTACKTKPEHKEAADQSAIVQATLITDTVAYDTDDPAIWIHPNDADSSLIIGTDKDSLGSLYVFDLKGKILKRVEAIQNKNF
jgi:3-phytase